MKQPRINRRQFFKLSAFSAVAAAGLPAIGIAAVAAAPSKEAIAASEQPESPAIPQPTFNPISSNTTFGPLTDISMGWDGTLWGIDGQGAPHIYDEINKVWAQHGDSIDAAFVTSDGSTGYVFKGNEVIKIAMASLQANAPTTLAALWPNLPDSFKLGVMGASGTPNADVVIVYNGGRFAATDGSIPATKLTDISGWPQTPAWKDGIIDGVVTIGTTIQEAYLIRSGEYIIIDPIAKAVLIGPTPYNPTLFIDPDKFPPAFASGFDAATEIYGGALDGYSWFFKGTTVVAFYPFTPEDVQIKYIGNFVSNWPAAWHPVLQHAPNGRDGNMWAATTSAQGNAVIQHNGESWTQLSQQADHVGVGQDNTVVIASGGQLMQFDGQQFNSISNSMGLVQVSLGNAGALYARDGSNNIYNFDQGNVDFVTDVSPALHIAVSNDGSLWHAKQNDANMNRLLVGSNLPPQAIPVKQGIVAGVSKVAGTGFGAAHCLTQDGQGNTQLYRYDSPYVFKTRTSYGTGPTQGIIEQGGGLLYFTAVDSTAAALTQLVALDAHTGAEIARNELTFGGPVQYGQPVFDPLLNLIYVATAPIDPNDGSTGGMLLGLDARTLVQKWAFFTPAGIDPAPVLKGTRLFVSDRTGTTYLINTNDALANPFQVPTVWTVNPSSFRAAAVSASTTRVSAPLVIDDDAGLLYTSNWAVYPNGDNQTWNVDGFWFSYHTADGSEGPANTLINIGSVNNPNTAVQAPVLGKMNVATSGPDQLATAVYYNCYNAVVGVSGSTTKTFNLPAGDFINTGFAYDKDANTLWFGTLNGVLYCLDTNLSPINHTPFSTANSTIETTPVIYTDTKGNKTIYFNAFVPGSTSEVNGLAGFDPDGGNVLSVATGATQVKMMSGSVTNGTIYVGGRTAITNDNTYPQVFAIRVDNLAQGVRDFIIESQLMQDPDETATNGSGNIPSNPNAPQPANPIPPSVARYQTHLTVVDDQKSPQANEPIKIWADVDGTVINVNSAQYTIGPADGAYASVVTGVDGAVVITINATNVNTTALRVWASFMDPFERIVVYPDHEFHGRAAQSNANGSVDDPAKPNLNTAYSYKPDPDDPSGLNPKPLFNSSDKNQGIPTNVANAVGQMNAGLNPGGNSAASVAKSLKTVHASDPSAPYVAYTDLGGMHYGPNNARAKRTATVAAPIGFQLKRTFDPVNPITSKHTYTPLNHSDARNAIDALDGTPWVNPNNPSLSATKDGTPVTFVVSRSDDIFTDFWNWLVGIFKKAVDTIENVIVSVADDIMVGINFVVGGIKQAFKAIIKVIEDVCNAIGAFFVQLLKDIEEVLEALSVLFQFGEIIKTHNWLKAQFSTQLANFEAALTNQIQQNIDLPLSQAEAAIQQDFTSFEAALKLTPDAQLNDVKGSKATPHTMFTVQPQGGGSSSQAVQAGWGTDKVKTNMPAATTASQASGASAQHAGDDSLTTFFTNLVGRLTGTGDLAGTFSNVRGDLSNLFNPSSASQFFSTVLKTLLDLIEDLVVSALKVAGAAIDTLVGQVATDAINAIWAALTTNIDFPIISWLYQLLFGEPLTILNLITLVAAIPMTMIFKVVEGAYPSQLLPASADMSVQSGNTSAAPAIIQRMLAAANGIVVIVYGFATSVCDATPDDSPPIANNGAVGLGFLSLLLGLPLIYNDSDTISAWDWGVYGVGAFITLLGGLGLTTVGLDNSDSAFLSVIEAIIGVAWIYVTIKAFQSDGKTDPTTDVGFAANIITTIPIMLNPVKFLGEIAAAVVAIVDVVAAFVVAGLSIYVAWASTDSATPTISNRLYLPWVAYNP